MTAMKTLFDMFETWLQGLVNTCVSGLDSRIANLEQQAGYAKRLELDQRLEKMELQIRQLGEKLAYGNDADSDSLNELHAKVQALNNAMDLLTQRTIPGLQAEVRELSEAGKSNIEDRVADLWDRGMKRRVENTVDEVLERTDFLEAAKSDSHDWRQAVRDAIDESTLADAATEAMRELVANNRLTIRLD